MKEFELQEENRWGDFSTKSFFDSYEEAMIEAARMFDSGESDGDFRIIEAGNAYRVRGYMFVKEECPICGKEVRRYQMERTLDCHGIPFRLVCGPCYDRIMDERGFDGERYTDLDECIDANY